MKEYDLVLVITALGVEKSIPSHIGHIDDDLVQISLTKQPEDLGNGCRGLKGVAARVRSICV